MTSGSLRTGATGVLGCNLDSLFRGFACRGHLLQPEPGKRNSSFLLSEAAMAVVELLRANHYVPEMA